MAWKLVGLGRVELPTSPLSGVRSSHLSYRPSVLLPSWLRRREAASPSGEHLVELIGIEPTAS